ncbi:bifunctional diaminohydroxyphosphoribosylaminopyrimidine deaminase/5-amino-6-(5-phosphoribosylamino)uracil reductase RibD [Rhizobium rosettiformans]|uniref:bifunctional diaminohydroxyphosphoribosylaminopyrimidine deaminase/5-amino-6-(5-phosphoribosylamino)uracil reductase RibD n=1 Tax=Rhizobium rosettiformans TaxID=1368430 RepID=UPI0028542722|nr:bifunctional diaminohydroxyphosphoribosylaminopyrimidine deaminase/5-amino-6-(5-phosphoribosylamino)uracil reductase RibD [Rhizobium rosettiformans]MDR7027090.1 diaminohydroxyphosphoribosylaminopyrimidine deaminase/5-amino-6-(5-phosphoribosylamino)uracil reductase [Rhizobium rosettiformans]MDR7065211.1 diaminohydroxyphosphoribosylaminopyrimidine deaminase/5-amino-6-(5-phosphoribosylamino)uracil reductase [Rhizobium rosettiformans]
MSITARDERYMREAIKLSETHVGRTGPNPSVGCVIVKDGEIVGRGVTALGGRPHAEPQAIAEAGEKARGATAYVTLEPCSHHGKTPPCANAIVAAGIARVVVAVADPDPRVSGRGLKILADADIEVTIGILQKEARRAMAGYLTRQTKGRPQVTLKLAVSADGMLGRLGEGQVAITGPEARADVHRLRAESDAILVGIGTALADDPELTVRLPGLEDASPIRIVLDRRAELPPTSKLAATAKSVPVIAAVAAGSSGHRSALQELGVEVVDAGGIEDLLALLAQRGVSSLMVEGGARVASDLLARGLVDRIHLYDSSVTIGPGGISSPITADHLPAGFVRVDERKVGADRLQIFERLPASAWV